MRLLLVATLVFYLLADSVAQESCCFPDKMEGQRLFVEDKKTRYFIVDYTKARALDTEDLKSDEFQIYDLANEKVYFFNKDGCRYFSSVDTRFLAQCANENNGNPKAMTLGPAVGGLDVIYYTRKMNNLKVFRVVTRDCTLLTGYRKKGKDVKSIVFSNIRKDVSTVSDNRVYTSFEGCKKIDSSQRFE